MKWLYPEFPSIAAFAVPFPMALMVVGQDSALILLASLVAFICFCAERDFLAGVVLSLLLIKPQFAVPIVLVLGFRYWRVLAGFSIGAALFVAHALWMVGIEGFREMIALGKLEDANEVINRNTNLRGLVCLIHGDHAIVVLVISAVLIVLAATLKTERDKAFSFAVLVCQLVSFHGHLCDMLPVLIPMAVLWKGGKMFRFIVLSTAMFILVFAIPSMPFQLLAVPIVLLVWEMLISERVTSSACIPRIS